jgi:hypothetical protein
VSAHSFIEIGQRHLLLDQIETWIPDLAALFTEAELFDDGEGYGYVAAVEDLRDRLQLHGFTAAGATGELEAAVHVWHGMYETPEVDDLDVPVRDTAMVLKELRTFVNSTDRWRIYHEPEEVFSQLDPRTVLRLALDSVADPKVRVRYNMDALASASRLERGFPLTDRAREDRRENMARDAPLVVLTEGSTDSRLLAAAIGVTHPHLVGFLRFMDFSSGAEGSAASLVRTVRSFVGAGIANRVLALADNDTAAYDALFELKAERLPDGYRVAHYPDLPFLRHYPTLGPQSDTPVLMDVNGKAGSLEMYLGSDLLSVTGELAPVQWTGYFERQRSYQGVIGSGEKKRLHVDFAAKVKSAIEQPSVRVEQDWSGVEAIVDVILQAFP